MNNAGIIDDVTFVVNDTHKPHRLITVNSYVLSVHCPIFKRVLFDVAGNKRRRRTKFMLDGLNSDGLLELIRRMYSGKPEITNTDSDNLNNTARRLGYQFIVKR